jgi:hypothetical protein
MKQTFKSREDYEAIFQDMRRLCIKLSSHERLMKQTLKS